MSDDTPMRDTKHWGYRTERKLLKAAGAPPLPPFQVSHNTFPLKSRTGTELQLASHWRYTQDNHTYPLPFNTPALRTRTQLALSLTNKIPLFGVNNCRMMSCHYLKKENPGKQTQTPRWCKAEEIGERDPPRASGCSSGIGCRSPW